jgi:hypothetical protein
MHNILASEINWILLEEPVLSSGIQCLAVRWKLTQVSEEYTCSFFDPYDGDMFL